MKPNESTYPDVDQSWPIRKELDDWYSVVKQSSPGLQWYGQTVIERIRGGAIILGFIFNFFSDVLLDEYQTQAFSS